MKNYTSYTILKNNNKTVKNIANNPKLNKYFSLENQPQNYQDIPRRNLKNNLTLNFEENIFPSNNLKREQRSLEDNNKSSPKINKKINSLNEDEFEIIDVTLNFDYSDHSTNISNQNNNKNFNNEITKNNHNNSKDNYIKNIMGLKSDIENIIKKNRNRSSNPDKINRVNPKEISSKNTNHVLSNGNKKRNYDYKGKTDNKFYPKNNFLKNNQFLDKIIEKKDKKDCYFNDWQNIDKIKANSSSKKNNNYLDINQILTYEIDSNKGYNEELLCNNNIIDNCQSYRRLNQNLIKEPNNIEKLLDKNKCLYELCSFKRKSQELEEEKNRYKNQYENLQNQINFSNDKYNDISQKNAELIRQNEELKRINSKLCAAKNNENKLNEKINSLFKKKMQERNWQK